jgi:circadian clock protein KaiB
MSFHTSIYFVNVLIFNSKAVVERRGFRPKFSMSQYLLKLYIMGDSSKSQRAIANIFRICREELSDLYTVEIIDVLEQPQLAEQDKILVTPTLVKQLPPPLQRIIGDMSNTQKVLLGLDVIPKDSHLN